MSELIELAAVQENFLSVFVSGKGEQRVRFDMAKTLQKALEEALDLEVKLPHGISLSFNKIADVFPKQRTIIESWKEGFEDIVEVFRSRNREEFEKAWNDLWDEEDWQRALTAVYEFGAHQALLGVSFVTTLRYFTNVSNLADRIKAAFELYFFEENGFKTVDGISVRQPVFPAFAPLDDAAMTQLKNFFGLQTAERYLRDLIRITIETAGDEQYDLEARISRIDAKDDLSDDARKLAKNWLGGFASMSEGIVMSSVEQLTQGVGSFRANPLLAAAASTSAAIAARKATQHAFLWQMDIN